MSACVFRGARACRRACACACVFVCAYVRARVLICMCVRCVSGCDCVWSESVYDFSSANCRTSSQKKTPVKHQTLTRLLSPEIDDSHFRLTSTVIVIDSSIASTLELFIGDVDIADESRTIVALTISSMSTSCWRAVMIRRELMPAKFTCLISRLHKHGKHLLCRCNDRSTDTSIENQPVARATGIGMKGR